MLNYQKKVEFMKTYFNGQTLKPGFYISSNLKDVKFAGKDGSTFNGTPGRYFRVPTPIFVAATPLMGLLFVILFPVFIACAVCAAPLVYFARLIGGTVIGAADSTVSTVGHFTWQPIAAYLSGNRGKKGNKKNGATVPEELRDVERVVVEGRKQEE